MENRPDSLQKNIRFYITGETIFREGDPGDLMYIILDGDVDILKSAVAGSSKVLSSLKKGEFFGEMALIDDHPRSASAVCKKDAKLLAMTDALLDSYIETNPDFAVKMIRNLALRLRNANKLIEQALSGNNAKTVYEGLWDYCQEKGIETFKGWRIGVNEFAVWAGQHLGIPEKAIPDILRVLLERGFIVTSAMGENEIIYPKRT